MAKHPQTKKIPEGYRRLEGSERRARKGAQRVGPADPNEQVMVSVYVRRRPGSPPLPDQSHWAATPPGQRTFLSREEFAQRYGASPDDLKVVTAFAASHGLKVLSTSAARRLVQLSGTVEHMNTAFAVELGRYQSDKETYRGREGSIHLPNHVADVVEGVFGLDNRRIARRASNGGPAGASPLTPPQVAKLYSFPTTSAAGQTIGLLEFAAPDDFSVVGGGYNESTDIKSFFTGLGLATPKLTAVGVDGATNSPTGDPNGPDGEIALDIDVAGSVAPGAALAVYFAPIGSEQDWADIVTTAVNDATNKPSVLSCSWGWSELEADAPTGDTTSPWPFEWTQMLMNKMSQTFQEAAMMGVTIFFAAGDHGSDNFQGDMQAHVWYPTSDPWVTACGGTIITNVSGSSFTEDTWNDVSYGGGATGGGVSEVFDLPAWQQEANVPASVNTGHHVGRGLPDIAGNASSFSGYNIIADGVTNQVGGTSGVAPLYAGLIALINASLGQPIGYLNPTLYALAADPSVSGVFRDINDGVSNGINGAPGYTSGPGWDACTGLGVVNGEGLLGQLQTLYATSVSIGLDRDHYGQDEIDALRTQPGGAVVKGAFFVFVDGFTPKQLGIVDSTSLSAAPVVTFSPSTGLTNPAACSSLQSDDPSFGPEVQRFRFGYDVNFGNDDSAFGFSGDSETVTLSTSFQGLNASAQVQFIKQPDPYIMQGPQTWWLSNDVRLIQVAEGGTQFGVTMGTDPFAFLSSVTSALEAGTNGVQGVAGGQSFDDNTQEDVEVLTVAPQNTAGQNVYNFGIARVHYQGLSSQAQAVRVFFRLFAANSTATDFQPGSTYLRYPAVYPVPPAQYFENVLPTLGVLAGEYVSVPCFGEARKSATQNGTANSLPSLQTPDTFNVRNLSATGGPVHDTFYGCWLDINQTQPVLPTMPPSGNEDGPWPSGVSVEPLRQAFIVNDHQCLVAEIAFDPVPINTGTPPWNSDKLAQRNISWSYVANPGTPASRQALEPFEVRPTPSILGEGDLPDELMIDWTAVPTGQQAEIYLPAVDADSVLAKSVELYRAERLTRVDAHTIGCTTGGVTYIPLPTGSGDGANFVGLLSVNLPQGITKGQSFTVVVRQLTNASATVAPPPPPPPPIHIARGKAHGATPSAATAGTLIQWRRVLGTFQVNIPVSTKEILLPREEQRLSIFRWIAEAMPPQRRWYPVFQRYLQGIANRVGALGGNPNKILPSPGGNGGLQPHPKEKHRLAFTGKIAGLLFDHFGDFEGFLLDTEECEHKFFSREKDMVVLAERVWRERLRITVWAKHDEPHRALSIIVWQPPAPFSH
jgi:hypothetical protein